MTPTRSRILALLHACAALALLLQASGAEAQTEVTAAEYELKAIFLVRFAQFVDWPAGTWQTPDDPLVIGVVGPDPFGAYLDMAAAGERVAGHRLVVRRYDTAREAGEAHVLFVNQSGAKLAATLGQLRDRPVLTVGDSADFLRREGMIQFVVVDRRIRFRINPLTGKDTPLVISSKLLAAALPGEPRVP